MKEQGGFTLIELVVVIVILGILAATALPKFVDLSSDARTAAIQGAAGALTSYSAINAGAVMARGTGGAGIVRVSTTSAAAALTSSMIGWNSAQFAISSQGSCAASTLGAAVSATLTFSGGVATTNSAVATIICTG